jgi:hypothetical protein
MELRQRANSCRSLSVCRSSKALLRSAFTDTFFGVDRRKEADVLVTRSDPGVVSPLAELRGHERQAAEELGQGKTHHEERKVIDATPAAIKPTARHGGPAQVFPANGAPAEGRPRMNGVIGWSGILRRRK